jgi:Xaa-Pro aminopeptidase
MSKHPFEYQAPTPAHVEAITVVREATKAAYDAIVANVPACAERTLAMRSLEEASMWANKAIVFDGERYLDYGPTAPRT